MWREIDLPLSFPPQGVGVRPYWTDEADHVHERADHRGFARARGWCEAADLARKYRISELFRSGATP